MELTLRTRSTRPVRAHFAASQRSRCRADVRVTLELDPVVLGQRVPGFVGLGEEQFRVDVEEASVGFEAVRDVHVTELVFWNETANFSSPKVSIAQEIASSAPISSTSAEISAGSTTRPRIVGTFPLPFPFSSGRALVEWAGSATGADPRAGRMALIPRTLPRRARPCRARAAPVHELVRFSRLNSMGIVRSFTSASKRSVPTRSTKSLNSSPSLRSPSYRRTQRSTASGTRFAGSRALRRWP